MMNLSWVMACEMSSVAGIPTAAGRIQFRMATPMPMYGAKETDGTTTINSCQSEDYTCDG